MAQYNGPFGQTQSGTHVGAPAVDAGLRSYMLRVYNLMALGVAATAVVTLLLMNNPQVMQAIALGPMKWVLFAAILGLGWFAPKIIFSGSTVTAHVAYWAYAALWGALISPMIMAFLMRRGGDVLIFRAFAITAVTFGATSLFGYATKKDLSGWGTFLMMATVGLLVAILGHALFAAMGWVDGGTSKMLSLGISCVVVLIFSAVTAYETQAIKEMYYAQDSQAVGTQKAIFGAFMLYGSFITLFMHILNILGIVRSD